MVVIDSGSVISVNELQPPNAFGPIELTDSGIVNDVRDLQRLNADSLIVVTELGIIISGSAKQL